MQKPCVYVSVVGFTDVERHALNTIFRLSSEREPTYAPWLNASGGYGVPAEVALVDGECSEAVVHRAREAHEGQRLIWVGDDPPPHAWRVLERPIHWASLLNDLDMVYAARQADSGQIDLDVSTPTPLDASLMELGSLGLRPSRYRRALLVGANEENTMYLKGRLSLAAVVEVDEAQSNEAAMDLMGRYEYVIAILNMDNSQVDAWSLAQQFRQRNPQAVTLGMSEHAGPLADWWSRRRMKQSSRRTGVHALVAKPPRPWELAQWLETI